MIWHLRHLVVQSEIMDIGLNTLPLDAFVSRLDYLLGYFTGEFRALQLIVLVVPCINHLPNVCWSIFWKSNLNDNGFVSLT